ncbi:MAG: hypothetical protein L3J52_09150 [Proteobacteria bacterium]|nr:hypothetical protein [Pseudomonadota bacterium]
MKLKTLFILFLLMSSKALLADVLLIDRIQNSSSLELPNRSSTMDQVQNEFGEPQQISAAVGTPPITKWTYPKFSVYFERQWVINAVIHKASPNEIGPKYIEN